MMLLMWSFGLTDQSYQDASFALVHTIYRQHISVSVPEGLSWSGRASHPPWEHRWAPHCDRTSAHLTNKPFWLQLWLFAAKCSESQHITLFPNGPKSCFSSHFLSGEVAGQGLNLVINFSPPPRRFSPSFIWAPAERRLVSRQYLIINFHQHCESRMDSFASRVVTPGMGFNGPSKEEAARVCVFLYLSSQLFFLCLKCCTYLHVKKRVGTKTVDKVKKCCFSGESQQHPVEHFLWTGFCDCSISTFQRYGSPGIMFSVTLWLNTNDVAVVQQKPPRCLLRVEK